jgi:hypothetical protein
MLPPPPATTRKPRASSSFDTRARDPQLAAGLAQGVGELQIAAVPRRMPPPEVQASGFTPARQRFASYLLALDAIKYPTTPALRDLMRMMLDIKSEAEAMFPLGHPNCKRDVERTGGRNRILAAVVDQALIKTFDTYSGKAKKMLMPPNSVSGTQTKGPSRAETAGIYAYFGVLGKHENYSFSNTQHPGERE